MNHTQLVRISKRLSRHLRHAPEEIGLTLGNGGWVSVTELLTALNRHSVSISRAELEEVVKHNDKQRFAFDNTGRLIRANQGHSVAVELNLPEAVPPEVLFHGTVGTALDAIHREGLRPMRRHHVHLSATQDTAVRVGARRGKPVVLQVDAARMVADGFRFYVSTNGVWLTDAVPPKYLT